MLLIRRASLQIVVASPLAEAENARLKTRMEQMELQLQEAARMIAEQKRENAKLKAKGDETQDSLGIDALFKGDEPGSTPHPGNSLEMEDAGQQ